VQLSKEQHAQQVPLLVEEGEGAALSLAGQYLQQPKAVRVAALRKSLQRQEEE
jgi:hypothetical protein